MAGLEKRLLSGALWRVLTQRAVLPWILRFADGLPADAEALEVGCGGGFNAEALLERFGGWRLLATDYDTDMVSLARSRLARFGARARVEPADATALPYDDGSFDLVVSIGVWHHVGAWEIALSESARVLRPGGSLLLVDLLRAVFVGPLSRLFPPGRAYTLAELRSGLAPAGFDRWHLRATGPFAYRLVAEKAA